MTSPSVTSSRATGGIQEAAAGDQAAVEQPNFKHVIKGRTFYFYYNGAHLHMVVLRTHRPSYSVVNTLDDLLSNYDRDCKTLPPSVG